MGPLKSASRVLSILGRFIGGVSLTGLLVILNFLGVLILLKSIFSGVSGIRSSPNIRRFLGVERKVTPSFCGERRPGPTLGGVRMVEWNELRFKSISGDHVTGRRLRPLN